MHGIGKIEGEGISGFADPVEKGKQHIFFPHQESIIVKGEIPGTEGAEHGLRRLKKYVRVTRSEGAADHARGAVGAGKRATPVQKQHTGVGPGITLHEYPEPPFRFLQ